MPKKGTSNRAPTISAPKFEYNKARICEKIAEKVREFALTNTWRFYSSAMVAGDHTDQIESRLLSDGY
jgi:hypothetical protein